MKKVLLGVAGLVLLLAGSIIFNTMNYGGPAGSADLSLPDVPEIESADAAAHLGEAIRIRTVTTKAGDPLPGEDQPWLDFRAFLETTYAEFSAEAAREIVAGYTLLYRWEGRDPALAPIVLMAHQDVVPFNEGTKEDWAYGPFAGRVADGYVWGRGAIDDKGSLVALMEAANALVKSGWQPERTIIFLFGHDEEVSGSGAEGAFARLKERGVKPLMVLDEGMMALDRFPLTGKPAGLIGIAEKGYMSVKVTARTEGGHSSSPPRESGAVRIARAIVALEENQMPADLSKPPFVDMVAAVGEDLPFMTRMAFANRWLFGGLITGQAGSDPSSNAMLRTTTAPTMMTGSAKENILPQRASAVVNFRIHPSNTPEDVLAHIQDVTAGIEGLEIEPLAEGIGSPASPVSSTSSRPYKVLEAVSRDMTGGAPVAPAMVVGATDARYATAIADDNIYRFMPAQLSAEDLTGFHGTNERISVENVGRMVRGYMQIMVALGGE